MKGEQMRSERKILERGSGKSQLYTCVSVHEAQTSVSVFNMEAREVCPIPAATSLAVSPF